ncbi:hypothetical protein HOY80DRAFT_1106786 [Tuber brumale]|nr:hypothetical protein HOY80DRAFT_1106786 [Tuber brumale]
MLVSPILAAFNKDGLNGDSSGSWELETTADLTPTRSSLVHVIDGFNDDEPDKRKSVLTLIMNSSTEYNPEQEYLSASPLSSSPNRDSPSTPVTAEKLSAPGPSTIPSKRQAGSQSISDEPTKHNRVAAGSTVRDGNKKNGDRDGEIWQPLDLGGGKPPIDYDGLIRMGPEGQGAMWSCKIRNCLAIIPEAHTMQGMAVIKDHIKEHCITVDRDSCKPQEFPAASDNIDRRILNKLKSLGEVAKDIRKEKLKNFNEINTALIELKHQRERDLVLGAKGVSETEADGEFEAHSEDSEEASNSGKGRGKQ